LQFVSQVFNFASIKPGPILPEKRRGVKADPGSAVSIELVFSMFRLFSPGFDRAHARSRQDFYE